jgi:hypothetical protein
MQYSIIETRKERFLFAQLASDNACLFTGAHCCGVDESAHLVHPARMVLQATRERAMSRHFYQLNLRQP